MLLGRPTEMNWPTATAGLRGLSTREGDGPSGRQPSAWLGLASRGRAPCRGARWRDGAARPAAGGRLRPWQRKPASAIGVRGYGANEQAAKHG